MYFPLFVLLFLSSRLVSSDESAKIVIIGAGPAGIAAGSKLLKNNFKNVEILEAEDRIGGRVFSVKVDDAYVELGAEYCHGQEGNIVYELAKKYDILQFNPNHKFTLYYSDGEKIDQKLNEDIITYLFEFAENDLNSTEQITMKEGFLKLYNSTLVSKYKDDAKSVKQLNEAVYLMELFINSLEGTFSWEDSVFGGDFEISKGDTGITWKGVGYKTILDIMMDNYPKKSEKSELEKKIKLATEVENISRTGDKMVIKTKDGATIEADHVIFTPSVGVLKHDHKKLFTPELPEDKQKAIETIGFGAIMKIILRFKQPWWQKETFSAGFLWNQEDMLKIKDEVPEGPQQDGISWVASISSLSSNKYNPTTFDMWIAGKMVPEIEKLSDQVIQKGAMFVLRKFLAKDYNITEPEEILRNTWYTNPHFRGTYSHETPKIYESDTKYQNVLGAPIKDKNGVPVLMFAGEATNLIHYSTVHGAIETGFREADRLIQHYKKN